MTKSDNFHQTNLEKRRKCIFHLSSTSYDVYFRQMEKPLELLRIATAVQAKYKSFQSIEKMSTSKLKVIFTNKDDANKLVMDSFFSASYRVYIPAACVEMNGVIDLEEIDPSVIAQQGVGKFRRGDINPVPLLQINRLAKQSNDCGYVPSSAIKVTFAGTLLPDFVEVQKIRLAVRPYFPKPMFCLTCQRFGHTAKYCAKQVRCPKCFQHHNLSDCPISSGVCHLCKEHHTEISQCRIFKAKEKTLRKKTRQIIKSSFNAFIHQPLIESQAGVSPHEDPASTSTNEGPKVSSYKLKKQAQATSSLPSSSSNPQPKRREQTQNLDPPRWKKKKTDAVSSNEIPSNLNSCTIEHLVLKTCSAYNIDQSFVNLITTLMPIIQLLWSKIVEAVPLLGRFISP